MEAFYPTSQIPAPELDNILDNIGLPYSTLNTQHLTNGMLGAGDADVMVSLKGKSPLPTANYVGALRTSLPRTFPGATFYFLPADITTQILNFGLPAPLDVQFEGDDAAKSYELASAMLTKLRHVPGLTDIRVQQPFNYLNTLDIAVDR